MKQTNQKQNIRLNQDQFINRLCYLLACPRDMIHKMYMNVNTNMLDAIICGILLRSRDDASVPHFSFILEKILGQYEKEQSNLQSKDITFTVEMNQDGRFVNMRPRELKAK